MSPDDDPRGNLRRSGSRGQLVASQVAVLDDHFAKKRQAIQSKLGGSSAAAKPPQRHNSVPPNAVSALISLGGNSLHQDFCVTSHVDRTVGVSESSTSNRSGNEPLSNLTDVISKPAKFDDSNLNKHQLALERIRAKKAAAENQRKSAIMEEAKLMKQEAMLLEKQAMHLLQGAGEGMAVFGEMSLASLEVEDFAESYPQGKKPSSSRGRKSSKSKDAKDSKGRSRSKSKSKSGDGTRSRSKSKDSKRPSSSRGRSSSRGKYGSSEKDKGKDKGARSRSKDSKKDDKRSRGRSSSSGKYDKEKKRSSSGSKHKEENKKGEKSTDKPSTLEKKRDASPGKYRESAKGRMALERTRSRSRSRGAMERHRERSRSRGAMERSDNTKDLKQRQKSSRNLIESTSSCDTKATEKGDSTKSFDSDANEKPKKSLRNLNTSSHEIRKGKKKDRSTSMQNLDLPDGLSQSLREEDNTEKKEKRRSLKKANSARSFGNLGAKRKKEKEEEINIKPLSMSCHDRDSFKVPSKASMMSPVPPRKPSLPSQVLRKPSLDATLTRPLEDVQLVSEDEGPINLPLDDDNSEQQVQKPLSVRERIKAMGKPTNMCKLVDSNDNNNSPGSGRKPNSIRERIESIGNSKSSSIFEGAVSPPISPVKRPSSVRQMVEKYSHKPASARGKLESSQKLADEPHASVITIHEDDESRPKSSRMAPKVLSQHSVERYLEEQPVIPLKHHAKSEMEGELGGSFMQLTFNEAEMANVADATPAGKFKRGMSKLLQSPFSKNKGKKKTKAKSVGNLF